MCGGGRHRGGVCSDVRVAFTRVANAAFRDHGVEDALAGQPANAGAISAAAAVAAQEVEVLSDAFAARLPPSSGDGVRGQGVEQRGRNLSRAVRVAATAAAAPCKSRKKQAAHVDCR